MDSVNKYRHGVLVGNFVEDKFGKDLHEKVLPESLRDPIQTLPKSLLPSSTTTSPTPSTSQMPLLPDSSQIAPNFIRAPAASQGSQYPFFDAV